MAAKVEILSKERSFILKMETPYENFELNYEQFFMRAEYDSNNYLLISETRIKFHLSKYNYLFLERK